MDALSPLRLVPRLVEKPWGGRRLAQFGRALPPAVLIGESWDVADLDASVTDVPDPVSRVSGGPYDGATLADVIRADRPGLLGSVAPTPGGRFPLLVKHLDAHENLSVQVHPPAEMADGHDGVHLKTESWVVLAADPGAQLMLGVAQGVTPDELAAAFGTPAMVPLLRTVPAQVGDVHHLPAGLLHALGAGIVVAEVQTPSDTTYRLYDWTKEYHRAPRALHREEALEAVRLSWAANVAPVTPVAGDGLLVESGSYTVSRHRTDGAGEWPVAARDAPRVVIVVSGALGPGGEDPIGPAGVLLLPAAWQGVLSAGGPAVWLDVDLVP